MHICRFIFILLLILFGIPFVFSQIHSAEANLSAQTVAVKNVSSFIVGQGSVHSVQEAVLHFQTGGKMIYLSVKEGDKVYQGQTIAQLDTYALQRQLTLALNNYQSTRDSFDQTQQNAQNNLLQGNQKFILETTNRTNISGDSENNVINDIAKRILDQNQMNLNNSVINVELSSYALQLATLTAPFDGVIMHEDVNVPYQNITPLTGFSIADPMHKVFRANILSSDIDFVNLNASASVQLAGSSNIISGAVTKIYPQKIILSNGQEVYQVDITSRDSQKDGFGLLDQVGTATITNIVPEKAVLIPSWTVLNSSRVWVMRNGKQVLTEVELGKTHGDKVEVLNGINSQDKIITNPDAVAANKYTFL